ncbi:MAG TPA: HypC/HybG/HupF family hydrogenase formation chaperone [Candidatus Saccharimonadales bacterium]|nr:HypC/HybG/HupF family hydrogenase formation chaperone [Candidatus Saccharimonadales bacterium]
MCLGVPGKVLSVEENPAGMAMGKVSFAGVIREVCLAYVPDVQPGEYVIVHVGFAISKVSEEEAQETLEILRQMGELAELGEAGEPSEAGEPQPGPGAEPPPGPSGPRGAPPSPGPSGPRGS